LRLATLLAQAGSPTASAYDLKSQLLQVWNLPNARTDKHIHAERLRIFQLLSGDVKTVITQKQQQLDWKQCLGLHLWYHERDLPLEHDEPNYHVAIHHTSVGDSVAAYYESVQHGVSKHPMSVFVPPTEFAQPLEDALFQLIELYASGEHNLWDVLEPSALTLYATDYHVSWHLLTTFVSLFGSDSLSRMSRTDKQVFDQKYHQVAMGYVFQLEAIGLWEWAIYVLLFLPSLDIQTYVCVRCTTTTTNERP
jgi:hypothetical protein